MEQFLVTTDLQLLINALVARGYSVVGPTVQQQAIVYDRIAKVADLPRGWTDDQQPGRYRLQRRDDDACFGYVVGPHSWKKFLFPPITTLLRSQRTADGWDFEVPPTIRRNWRSSGCAPASWPRWRSRIGFSWAASTSIRFTPSAVAACSSWP